MWFNTVSRTDEVLDITGEKDPGLGVTVECPHRISLTAFPLHEPNTIIGAGVYDASATREDTRRNLRGFEVTTSVRTQIGVDFA